MKTTHKLLKRRTNRKWRANTVSEVIRRMLLPPRDLLSGLTKCSWRMRRGGEWFTVTVVKGDTLNDL